MWCKSEEKIYDSTSLPAKLEFKIEEMGGVTRVYLQFF